MGKRGPGFYAVKCGLRPGIYSTWAECNANVSGFPGAVYRKFSTQEEALAFIGRAAAKGAAPLPEELPPPVTSLGALPPAPSLPVDKVTPSSPRSHSADGDFLPIKFPISSQRKTVHLFTRGTIYAYTDGGAKPNPGPGGWAAFFYVNEPVSGEKPIYCMSGGFSYTTNNECEITAVLNVLMMALNILRKGYQLRIQSDSSYVINTITQGWLLSWRKNNWVRSTGEEVKNQRLWKMMYDVLSSLDDYLTDGIRIKWVPGHQGIEGNEICDRTATYQRDAHSNLGACPTAPFWENLNDIQTQSFCEKRKQSHSIRLFAMPSKQHRRVTVRSVAEARDSTEHPEKYMREMTPKEKGGLAVRVLFALFLFILAIVEISCILICAIMMAPQKSAFFRFFEVVYQILYLYPEVVKWATLVSFLSVCTAVLVIFLYLLRFTLLISRRLFVPTAFIIALLLLLSYYSLSPGTMPALLRPYLMRETIPDCRRILLKITKKVGPCLIRLSAWVQAASLKLNTLLNF